MGYDNQFTVPPIGLSGSLALFWKKDITFDVLASSPKYIDTKIKAKGKSFYLTFVYRHPMSQRHQEVWNQISELGANRTSAWLLSGDFNDILENAEKKGGPSRHEGSFINFWSFVSHNGLWDVKHSSNPLSWRGMHHNHFVRARLDRSLSVTMLCYKSFLREEHNTYSFRVRTTGL